MAFEKGNQHGAKPKLFDQALRRAISQFDGEILRECADTLLSKAKAGEPWAVQMLADRLDGKAVQAIEASGDLSLTVQILRHADSPTPE